MKRSELNALAQRSIEFCEAQNFHLPPFAFWTADDWKTKGHECDEIRDNMLGWDITDLGQGRFEELGVVLFTLRNGSFTDRDDPKTYCEKLILSQEDQIVPMHFHWNKVEDIIVRAGGNMLIQLYNSTPDEKLADSPVEVSLDGVRRTVPAGEILRLTPGESITLTSEMFHKFWGEHGKGTVLIGEVSKVNDDNTDNCFLEPLGRWPDVEEDEPVLYYLCNEYPPAL